MKNIITICPKCGKEFLNNTKRKFCSRHCANSRIQTKEIRFKKSQTLLGHKTKKSAIDKIINKYKNKYYITPRKCLYCGDIIPYEKRYRLTCNNNCYIEYKRIKALQQEVHGGGKKGWYKGYWCDSSWELAYIIYCLDHNINIKRNYKSFNYQYDGNNKKYIPDFIVDNQYIEIKGYYTEIVDIKAKSVQNIKILYYKDLKYVFDYIQLKYNKNKFHIHELYDNYKLKFEKICPICNNIFKTNKKNQIYCSHNCQTKYIRTKEIRNKISIKLKK